MTRWRFVSHNVPNTENPKPPTPAPTTSSASGARVAIAAMNAPWVNVISVATSSGRRGRTCSATTPPTTAPTPLAVSAVAHGPAPP